MGKLIDTQDAAALLGVCPAAVRLAARRGMVPVILGRHGKFLYDEDDILARRELRRQGKYGRVAKSSREVDSREVASCQLRTDNFFTVNSKKGV